MLYLTVLVPLAVAGIAFAVPSNRWRPWLLPVGALGHLLLVLSLVLAPDAGAAATALGRWLLLDALGKLFLGFLSVLFFLCSLYAPGYLATRAEQSNRVLCVSLLVGLAMMTLVTLSHHLGLMWVAMETTTLVSAPSIYFYHNA